MELSGQGFDNPPKKEGEKTSVIVLDKDEVKEMLPSLFPVLADVTDDALGGITSENLKFNLRQANSLLLLMSSEGIVGFAGYHAVAVKKVGLVVDQSIRMLRKNYQGKGYGTDLTRIAVARYPDAKYLTFATQNPAVVVSVQKAVSPEFIAPIDKPFMGEDPEIMFDLMRTAGALRLTLDPSTGIHKGAYRHRLGDYDVDLTNPRISQIETAFENAGMNRDQGDAMFFMAKLPAPPPSI